MKLLYDHSIFRLQCYGGISRYFYELITKLSVKDNVNINLFEGFHINEYELSNHKKEFSLYKGYKIPDFKYAGYAFEIIDKIWFNNLYSKLDFDIYHPTYYRKDLAKFKKVPIVLTVYDMIHELYSEQFWNSKSVKRSKINSINSADIIISISENTKKDLIEIYNVPEEKIKVVYLANSLRTNYVSNYSRVRPYILYVGDREGYKNFSILLKVYMKHFSERFDLICFGGKKFNYLEFKTIKEHNLSNKVFSLRGPDYLLTFLYKNAFCLVFPSLYEGFGIPPLEAMAMSCPVIASNTSSITEVVGNASIKFDPTSEESLFKAIDSLENNILREKLIKLGLEQEKKFSWEKTANETLDIYENIT